MTDRKPASDSPAPSASRAHRGRPATAQELKAFAHPLRMEMYRLLGDRGEATASMLARATGESTGQTSYHLRQLAKFGFVEEVPGEGTARERWWRALGFSYDRPDDPPARVLNRYLIDSHAAVLHEATDRAAAEPEEWRGASTMSSTSTWMTRDELAALTEELLEVVERHTSAAKEQREAAGPAAGHLPSRADERRVRIYVDTVPLPESDG